MRIQLPAASLFAPLACTLLAACGGSRGAYPLCVSAADCESGQVCSNGVCGDVDAGAPGAIGSACAARSDCASGLSCIPDTSGFPNGYCSANCTAASCEGSAVCADLTSSSLGTEACASSCSTSADCREDYVCCPPLGNVCLPPALCESDSGPGGGSGGG